MRIAISIQLVFLLILCSCNNSSGIADGPGGQSWKDWAESSDVGLWEGDISKCIKFDLIRTYGDDISSGDMLFTSIEAFAVSGDTIFVSDQCMEELVAFDLDGNLLWRFGEKGEGPGHFARIGQVAVSSTSIAVANINNSRVELISRSGKYIGTIPIQTPYDLCYLDDSTLVIISHHESNSIIHVRSIYGEVLADYGEWVSALSNFRGNRNFHCVVIDDRHLYVNSYYENKVNCIDLLSKTQINEFSRILPMEIPANEARSDGNGMAFRLYPVMLDIFAGPENQVNVLLRPISEDGNALFEPEDQAQISIIDRFSIEGNYLDSYIVPIYAGQAVFTDSNELFLSHEAECLLYRYEVLSDQPN